MDVTNACNIDMNVILLRLSNLEKEFQDVKNNFAELTIYNTNLKKEMNMFTTENESLVNTLYDMEVDITEIQQYSRRENIEFANMHVEIQQKDPEKYIIDLLDSIKVSADN